MGSMRTVFDVDQGNQRGRVQEPLYPHKKDSGDTGRFFFRTDSSLAFSRMAMIHLSGFLGARHDCFHRCSFKATAVI